MRQSRTLVCRGQPDPDGRTRRLVCSVRDDDRDEPKEQIAQIRRPVNGYGVPTFFITQADVAKGTLRIKNPGYYLFKQDVVFNAPVKNASTRADTPLNGFWFAGITVEVDGVIIDGQGRKFSVAPTSVTGNVIGTFAVVLLGNNQFSGGLFGGGGSQFPDTTSYVAADNVLITNLTIVGNGAHFGIMGNNNTKVAINSCSIYDCQVADVYLQSGQGVSVVNNNLYGSTTPVQVSQELTQLELLRQSYDDLIAQGTPGAATRRAALEAYVSANNSRFKPTTQKYPTSNYGLFMAPGPTALFPFPMTPDAVSSDAALADAFFNGEYNTNVVVSGNTFNNFTSLFTEVVALGTNIPENPIFPLSSWPLIIFGLFGALQWKDAFNSSGKFAPNDFLKAMVFIMNNLWPNLGPVQGLLPANSLAIFDAILNNNATEFFQNAAPIVSRQSDGLTAKGLFAMRIIAVDGGIFTNNKVTTMKSLGPAPIVPSTLPGYSKVASPQAVFRSPGNDLWAMAVESCENLSICSTTMSSFSSNKGYIFGVDLAESVSNIVVSDSTLTNCSAPNTAQSPTLDASDIFGFVTGEDNDGNIGTVTFSNLTTKNLVAGGTVVPFSPARNTPPLLIKINCRAL